MSSKRGKTRQRRLGLERLERRLALAAGFAEFVDPNPSAGNGFGTHVVPLSTGNVVITAPKDDAGGMDAGAVYLFNGRTGELISTLTGLTGEQVGSGGVMALKNGNFVALSPHWASGVATDAGAVTWGSGIAGVGGVVSSENSLVGTSQGDSVGSLGVTALENGNYVVVSPLWGLKNGAVTWGSGTGGIQGTINADNSLVGGVGLNDKVGSGGVTVLSNGNFVVVSPNWGAPDLVTDGNGAVTFGDGSSGVTGLVGSSNSLVGSNHGDSVGYGGVTALPSGNYVVVSPYYDYDYDPENPGFSVAKDTGAVTFGSGMTGVHGVISPAASLIGGTANSQLGSGGVTVLTNGNFVVSSPLWVGTSGNGVPSAGAVTWGDGIGTPYGSGRRSVRGFVDSTNSLVGSTKNDQVGSGGVTALANGNYIVSSPYWNNGARALAGAVTWGDGTTGVKGVVSETNSLVSGFAGSYVGDFGVKELTNGNYVVRSPGWRGFEGAVTWGDGASGVRGTIDSTNSLVGDSANGVVDHVGSGGVFVLANGNYVVTSPTWNNGAATSAGAVTWGNGAGGTIGVVSDTNSLVGAAKDGQVGSGGVTMLANGNYVVSSPDWNSGLATNCGAVTWGDGTMGVAGFVGADNSLVGSQDNDNVGSGGVKELTNGNLVVLSPFWDNRDLGMKDAGAVTWVDGTNGIHGVVSVDNSLVGNLASDRVGYGGVRDLTNGNYVVSSPFKFNLTTFASNAGAVTWGDGTSGTRGYVSDGISLPGPANSLVGTSKDDFVGTGGVTALTNGNYVVTSRGWSNYTGAVTWGDGASGVSGAVSAANSLVGSSIDDTVGSGGVTALPNGNFLVRSPDWNKKAGALTFGSGTMGIKGEIDTFNSLIGGAANTNLQPPVLDDVNKDFYGNFLAEGHVRVGSQIDGLAHPWHLAARPLDVNNDAFIVAGDALTVVNYINTGLPDQVAPDAEIGAPYGFLDVTGDDFVAPDDALMVINEVNSGEGEGEGEPRSEVGGRRSVEESAEFGVRSEEWTEKIQEPRTEVDSVTGAVNIEALIGLLADEWLVGRRRGR